MKKYLCLLFILVGMASCDKFPIPSKCGESIIIDSELFRDAPKDEFWLRDAHIHGDCLEITFQYGGGCGSIELKLIGQDETTDSVPTERTIRLSLKDNDLCEALLQETVSYDLKNARILGENEIILNLVGWDQPLVYKY